MSTQENILEQNSLTNTRKIEVIDSQSVKKSIDSPLFNFGVSLSRNNIRQPLTCLSETPNSARNEISILGLREKEYVEINRQIKLLQVESEKIRTDLLSTLGVEANGYRSPNIYIQECSRKGSLDLKKLAIIENVDVELYRNESTKYVKITPLN